jgi:hypothetical protein
MTKCSSKLGQGHQSSQQSRLAPITYLNILSQILCKIAQPLSYLELLPNILCIGSLNWELNEGLTENP